MAVTGDGKLYSCREGCRKVFNSKQYVMETGMKKEMVSGGDVWHDYWCRRRSISSTFLGDPYIQCQRTGITLKK